MALACRPICRSSAMEIGCSVFKSISSSLIKGNLLAKDYISITGKSTICTTISLNKRQSPLTVRVPRWKTAAIERKQLVTQMRKPKSVDTIKAEIQLNRNPVKLSLFTTSRIKPVPEEEETIRRLKPEVFLSNDEQMLICYHPEPAYPKELTKDVWERPKWYGNPDVISDYSDCMTDEQLSEARSLIATDSNLWSATMLGHMMKVKPSVVREKFPRTKEQEFRYHLERKMLQEFGKVRRMDYRKYQNKERMEYIRKSRGEEAVLEFKRTLQI